MQSTNSLPSDFLKQPVYTFPSMEPSLLELVLAFGLLVVVLPALAVGELRSSGKATVSQTPHSTFSMSRKLLSTESTL